MSLIRLAYISRYLPSFIPRREAVDNILETSRRNNQASAVTGFLMATEHCFAQILEGTRHDVGATYGRIVRDPRHEDIRIVLETAVDLRCFGNWSMGLAERDDDTREVFSAYGIRGDLDLARTKPAVLLDLAISLSFRQTRLGHPA